MVPKMSKDEEATRAMWADLESRLRKEFRTAGGSDAEWRRGKDKLVEDALAAATLALLEPKPESRIAPPEIGCLPLVA